MNIFVANFYITDNNQTFNFDIPYSIYVPNAKFIITGVNGSMNADGSLVNISIPEFTIPNIYNTVNNSHNIVATTVLNSNATDGINTIVDNGSIGYPVPNGIANQSANITIKVLNQAGVEYSNASINYINVEITFFM